MDYDHFMKKALEEAQAALEAGEFPVGCVMVHNDKTLVSGARKGTTGDYPNEVDHAEMVALRRLFRLDSKINPREVTVFSTLEPCLMCFGNMTPLYQSSQMTIIPGILRNESLKLLKTFFSEPENMYLRDSILAAYTLDQ
jgi:tRNA(adenine34) deaminase